LNCLLTGANGFLGESIKKELSKDNNVLSLSRTSGDYKISLEKEIPDFKDCIDFVIHAAGKAHLVPKNKKENTMYFNVNVQGTQNLLKGIELTGYIPKRFVFISTVAVYGLEKGINIDENKPLLANDPYGLSKVQAEKFVIDWCQENKVVCTILRLPLLVGENPPGNLGAMILAINKGYYFNIAGGKAKKSMVLAEDVAKLIFKASEIGGIYNLTDRNHPNFFELSNAIAKQNRKSNPFNIPFFIAKTIALFGDIIGDKFPLNSSKLKKITTDLTFDDSKARQVLGWMPNKVLDYYTR
jgi:nucleoside-diphosphate-sugar epimerase